MYQRTHTRSPHPARKPRRFARLPDRIDPAPLLAEIAAVAPFDGPLTAPWLSSQWKWHLRTQFLVLRGGPPTSIPGGRLTSGGGVDAPLLARLPRLRAAIDTLAPTPAALAWVGLSPPGACIFLHVDNTQHWDEHHRVHLPLQTTPAARLCVRGRFAHLPAGTLWAFDNSAPHGAINDGPPRLHLIVDLPPTPAVEAWLASGEPVDGVEDAAALARLRRDPLTALTAVERADRGLMGRLGRQ